MSYISTVYLNN